MQILLYEIDGIQNKDVLDTMMFKAQTQAQFAKADAEALAKNAVGTRAGALVEEVGGFEEKIVQLVDLKKALMEKENTDTQQKYDQVRTEILTRATASLLIIETEVSGATDKYTTETSQQASIFSQVNKSTAVLYGTSELTSLGLSVEGLATRLFTVNSAKEVDDLEASLNDIFGKIDKTAKSLDATLGELKAVEEKKMAASAVAGIASVKTLLFDTNGIVSKVRNELSQKEKATKAMEGLRSIVFKQAESAKTTMSTARSNQEQSIIEVNRVVRFSTVIIIVIGLIAVAFGIVFGVWIYRSISKPLSRLIGITDEIAAGNFTHAIIASSHDEIGQVEASMGKMVMNLKGIVEKIRIATGSLASSSEELSATARTLDQGSQNQASQVEQVAGAMEEMSQTTEDVAKNASETSEAAKSMEKIALDGKQTVHNSTTELNKFVHRVNESARQVESLGQSSEEIHNIVDLIREIADQTNLLALMQR